MSKCRYQTESNNRFSIKVVINMSNETCSISLQVGSSHYKLFQLAHSFRRFPSQVQFLMEMEKKHRLKKTLIILTITIKPRTQTRQLGCEICGKTQRYKKHSAPNETIIKQAYLLQPYHALETTRQYCRSTPAKPAVNKCLEK